MKNNSNTIQVLDHGFVTLRNLAGPTRRPERSFDAHDVDPAQAARMSFGNMDSDRTAEQDYKLADYLMRNRHTSPTEQIQIWLEMKLPIFVARQWVRHRSARLNEVSGRYITLPEEWYIPEVFRGKAKTNKQGSEDNLDQELQKKHKGNLSYACQYSYDLYKEALMDGVAPEQARLYLHLNHYTHWIWQQDLHNMMHLLSLRVDEHAQWEARQYAEAIITLLERYLPESMKLFRKYRTI